MALRACVGVYLSRKDWKSRKAVSVGGGTLETRMDDGCGWMKIKIKIYDGPHYPCAQEETNMCLKVFEWYFQNAGSRSSK